MVVLGPFIVPALWIDGILTTTAVRWISALALLAALALASLGWRIAARDPAVTLTDMGDSLAWGAGAAAILGLALVFPGLLESGFARLVLAFAAAVFATGVLAVAAALLALATRPRAAAREWHVTAFGLVGLPLFFVVLFAHTDDSPDLRRSVAASACEVPPHLAGPPAPPDARAALTARVPAIVVPLVLLLVAGIARRRTRHDPDRAWRHGLGMLAAVIVLLVANLALLRRYHILSLAPTDATVGVSAGSHVYSWKSSRQGDRSIHTRLFNYRDTHGEVHELLATAGPAVDTCETTPLLVSRPLPAVAARGAAPTLDGWRITTVWSLALLALVVHGLAITLRRPPPP